LRERAACEKPPTSFMSRNRRSVPNFGFSRNHSEKSFLSGPDEDCCYLKTGLAFILSFIVVKMLIADFFHIPILISPGIFATAITVSIATTRFQGK
jgi:hypothetical protein